MPETPLAMQSQSVQQPINRGRTPVNRDPRFNNPQFRNDHGST